MRLASRRVDWTLRWNPNQRRLQILFGSLVLQLTEGEARHLADRIHDTLEGEAQQ
ncbi:hypothetical protein [Skermania sp. ID1734]|uniref:hypothetical protein n=1 Tax=Skermania sp. ID1734 TaxID=2597516 RepID=UPI00163D4BCD|nr:hypothetical protein [Skermania sp. ID1734]